MDIFAWALSWKGFMKIEMNSDHWTSLFSTGISGKGKGFYCIRLQVSCECRIPFDLMALDVLESGTLENLLKTFESLLRPNTQRHIHILLYEIAPWLPEAGSIEARRLEVNTPCRRGELGSPFPPPGVLWALPSSDEEFISSTPQEMVKVFGLLFHPWILLSKSHEGEYC